jgi:hypothetical protein
MNPRRIVTLTASALTVWNTLSAAALAFIPSTKFGLEVQAIVTYAKAEKLFHYNYHVYSSPSSEQDVGYFGIYIDNGDISNVASPHGWSSAFGMEGQPLQMWYVDTISHPPILPGKTERGFSFLSRRLPSIKTWYAKSTYRWTATTPEEYGKLLTLDQGGFFNNSVVGGITGPGPVPSTDPNQMIAYLLKLQSDAFQAKWIRNGELQRSLSLKLEAAQRSIFAGKSQEGLAQLKAYFSEIKAHKGHGLGYTTSDLLLSVASCTSSAIEATLPISPGSHHDGNDRDDDQGDEGEGEHRAE